MKNKLLFIMLAVLFFSSCRKDDIVDTGTNPPAAEVYFAADIIGKVVDQDGNIIRDAAIANDGVQVLTDANGLFRWDDLRMGANEGTFLEAKAEGYYESGYRIYAGGIYDRTIEITLVKKDVSGYVNASAGDKVILESGLEIEFPANAFSTNEGEYNGLVTVHAYHLDPSEEGYLDRAPGDLSGTDDTGANYILESFGMLAVEMETADGAYVQLREGFEATITVPVDISLLSDAPATIPLWHFDETLHKWVKEGEAELINGSYVGQVSHFSWWNCDDFADAASLCIQIFDGRYQGSLEGLVVELTSESVGTSSDVTDTEGNVSGQVPANEILQVTVYDQCGEVVYSGTIGPYTGQENKEVIPVVLNNVDIYEFSGSVFDCETMSTLGDAIVTIFVEGNTYYVETDENGTYSVSLLICDEGADYTVAALSAELGMVGAESGTATISGINVLDVNLCNETPFLVIYNSDNELIWPTQDALNSGWADSVTGYLKPNEVIIRSSDANGFIVDDLSIGFSGLSIGNFPASLLGTFGLISTNDQCSVNITQFDSGIGGYVKGTIQGTNLSDSSEFTGSFGALIIE